MKAYKIVEGYLEKNHGLFSIVTRAVDGGVFYKFNEWVKAQPLFRKHGYHLLVFKTLGDAQRCAAQNWWHGGIYECQARGIVRKTPSMLNYLETQQLLAGQKIDVHQGFPTGTVMARRVKLTHFVQNTYDGRI